MTADQPPRRLGNWGILGVILAITAFPSFVAVFFLGGGSAPPFPDTRSVVADLLVPQALSLAVTVLVVTWLGLWRAVLHESLRTRAWVWLVPVALIVPALLLADEGRVIDAGAVTSLSLTCGVLLGVTSEELLFRGVILTELRQRTTEGRAAWTSSVIFGLSHLLGGPVQAVVSVFTGQLYYLCRRVSGGPVVPILAHTAWNLSVASAWLSVDPAERSTASAVLVLAVLGIWLVVGVARRRIEPVGAEPPRGRDLTGGP